MSELEKYLELPYTVVLRRDKDGDFVARIDELPGCSAHGKTREEALANLDEAKALWIEDCLANGDPVPLPVDAEALPSGKWLQRVPRGLHRKLQVLCKREGVSFNQYVTALLAEAAGERLINLISQTVYHRDLYSLGLPDQYFAKSGRALLPARFQVLDTTLTRAEGLTTTWLKCLSVMSAGLPNKFTIKSKVTKDEKRTHTSFQVS